MQYPQCICKNLINSHCCICNTFIIYVITLLLIIFIYVIPSILFYNLSKHFDCFYLFLFCWFKSKYVTWGCQGGCDLGERWHRFICKIETWNAFYSAFALRTWSFHKTKEAWAPIYSIRRAALSRPCINEWIGVKQSPS